MKKILALFIGLVLCITGGVSQVLVQGRLHPSAGTAPANINSLPKSGRNFTFDNIKFWVGTGAKRAALVIEWHDGNKPDALVWGYQWDGDATGHDMIVAIAKADPRLLLLTQQTGSMGYTICGLGYSDEKLGITYDLEGAIANPEKSMFRFSEPFPPLSPQIKIPETPAEDVAAAILEGLETGVIYHPFDQATYGYPSYDYDFWKCDAGLGQWKSGWYYGYWSYWVGDNADNLNYSGLGASGRQLSNGSWDGWSFQADMGNGTGGQDLSNRFIAAPRPEDPIPDPSGIDEFEPDVSAGIYYSAGYLHLQNLKGYRCALVRTDGQVWGVFDVSAPEENRQINIATGVYLLIGNKKGKHATFKLKVE